MRDDLDDLDDLAALAATIEPLPGGLVTTNAVRSVSPAVREARHAR